MSTALTNPELWFYARACRRLAGRISPEIAEGDSEEVQTAVEHLNTAAKQLVAIASMSGSALPSWLVENVLASMMESDKHVAGGPDESDAHEQVLDARTGFASSADLISFLSASQQTGILAVQTSGETIELEFLDGDIVHMQSDGAPEGERLGDILVDQGSVDRAIVEQMVNLETGYRVGLVLWRQNIVSQEQLTEALETQIRRQFARLFELDAERFLFWQGPPMRAHEQLRMNTTGLILDSARASDERTRSDSQ